MGRTCADFRRRKCNKKKWCTFNTSSRICEDAAVAPGMAEAAESAARMDRKGRTCADYGKRLCKKGSGAALTATARPARRRRQAICGASVASITTMVGRRCVLSPIPILVNPRNLELYNGLLV